jgi:hypothetical protein
LFHDTPTVQSAAAADAGALSAAALAGASLTAGASLWGAVVAVPPDEQADATIARVATSNPILLFTIPDSFLRFPHPPMITVTAVYPPTNSLR